MSKLYKSNLFSESQRRKMMVAAERDRELRRWRPGESIHEHEMRIAKAEGHSAYEIMRSSETTHPSG